MEGLLKKVKQLLCGGILVTKVKICGNTNLNDVKLAIDSGINWLMAEKKELWLQLLRKLASNTYNIYLGVGNNLARVKELPNLRAFGSCSAHFARQNHLDYIKGCPPSPESIVSLFELV